MPEANDPAKPARRKSIRLKDYDYTQEGYYFVTMCTYRRRKILCSIDGKGGHGGPPLQNSGMAQDPVGAGLCADPSDSGMAQDPVGAGLCAGPILTLGPIGRMIQEIWHDMPRFYPGIETDEFVVMPNHVHGIIVLTGRARGPAPTVLTLFNVIQRFKSLTTNRYWQYGSGKLWQRNYYERVIRNERELFEIRQYIRCNPDLWEEDEYHS